MDTSPEPCMAIERSSERCTIVQMTLSTNSGVGANVISAGINFVSELHAS